MTIPRNLGDLANNVDSNGTLQVAGGGTGVTTSTGTGSVVLNTNPELPANLNFTGTGNRITGDFSNATIANRVAFQTSTTNGQTSVLAIPNGTSTTAQFIATSTSDPSNSSLAQLVALSTESSLRAGITGSGTFQPLTFFTGGSERLRITTAGAISVGSSGTATGTSGQVLTSAGSGASPTWTTPSSGAMVLIATATANNTSDALIFTNVSGYSAYQIIIRGLQVATGGSNPQLQFGTGAGPTWQTSSYNWVLNVTQGGSQFSNDGPGGNGIILGFSGLVASSTRGYLGNILINSLSGPFTKAVIAQASFFNNGNNWTNLTSTGEWNNTTTVTAMRIISNNGSNIIAGSASLYGIAS